MAEERSPGSEYLAHLAETIDREKRQADAAVEWLRTVQVLALAAIVVVLLVFFASGGSEGFCGGGWNRRLIGGWNRRLIGANWNPYWCAPHRTSVPVPVVDFDQGVGAYAGCGPCRPQASAQYPFVPARPVPAYGDAWGDYSPSHFFAPRV